jgi:hypothetical protein
MLTTLPLLTILFENWYDFSVLLRQRVTLFLFARQVAEGHRPVTVGMWFSLGHSTIVVVLALLIAVGCYAVADASGGAAGNIGGLVS